MWRLFKLNHVHLKEIPVLVLIFPVGECICLIFVLAGFETLQKAFVKSKSVIEKEGATPTFYIRTLVEMEDFISQVKGVQLEANGWFRSLDLLFSV